MVLKEVSLVELVDTLRRLGLTHDELSSLMKHAYDEPGTERFVGIRIGQALRSCSTHTT